MPERDSEAKLQELDRRLQEGWNNLHSINQSRLEAVRNVVREQWAERQEQIAQRKERAAKQSKQSQAKKQKQGKSKRHGWRHHH